MARGGRIGPPHVTRARSSFNALDMFSQLTTFTTIVAGAADNRVTEQADNRLTEQGDNRVVE